MTSNEAYYNWANSKFMLFDDMHHDDDCEWFDEPQKTPINEYDCCCYEKAIFKAGFAAADKVECDCSDWESAGAR